MESIAASESGSDPSDYGIRELIEQISDRAIEQGKAAYYLL